MTGGDLRELGSSSGCGIRTTVASSPHGGSVGVTTSTSVGVLDVVAMAAVVVAVDVLIFRGHVWERPAANLGIVLVFVAFYFKLLHHR
jgi:hypothetical protein